MMHARHPSLCAGTVDWLWRYEAGSHNLCVGGTIARGNMEVKVWDLYTVVLCVWDVTALRL